ncbi:MAG: M3 family metallopeptidase [Gammaproteobacteria bacterium]|nr:M3 family metallopeptidase [Gammaproteobacteria bacterium]
MNPLLNTDALPAFRHLQSENIVPAIEQVLKENKLQIERLLQQDSYSWANLIVPLQQMDSRLSRVWSPVRHLNSVMNNERWRKQHDKCLAMLSSYHTELSQNKALFNAYKSLYDSEQFDTYNTAQKQCIRHALRDFELGGVALEADKQKRFKEIKELLSQLTNTFSQNVMDATKQWKKLITDKNELTGLPDFALDMLNQNAKAKNKTGYLLGLDFPSFNAVMTYADNRSLRKEVYLGYVTRASEIKDKNAKNKCFDNTEVIKDILEARLVIAELLGYKNYAEVSLAKKMANSTEEVLTFLNDLNNKSHAKAVEEFEELTAFAKETHALEKLQAWDSAYYAEKLKNKRYQFSQQELKPYFPASTVLKGLFEIVSRLYGIDIKENNTIETWHDDVLFFDIVDADNTLRGQFYLDLYSRENKQGGAWMDECVSRMQVNEHIQAPVAYLVCNLTPPVGDKPALFDHNEVTTLFHEFGHGLHHMLTQVNEYDVSGINGVEWDAVELPSQFMENWCWQKESLELISGHYVSGEKIPEKLFTKMLSAKNYRAASNMVRQLELALFDFELYTNYATPGYEGVQQTLDAVRARVTVQPAVAENRFQNSFSHIFGGGYAAGYYSYKWAEVLSADAFSMFEENGIFDKKTGKAFLNNILEKGGSEPAAILFKKFRGREPDSDALLRHCGLK